jgi:Fe2+ transport system protein FeoA
MGLNIAVNKSDLLTRISRSTRDPAPEGALRLASIRPGQTVWVVGTPEEARQSLAQEGVGPGTRLTVERRVGLGGPMIVRLGRARLAIARSVADGILVELREDAAASGPEP